MRQEYKQNLVLNTYDIAVVQWTYGGVLEFVYGTPSGLLLLDTKGHEEVNGIKMRGFIRKQIREGWGVQGDARGQLSLLSLESARINKSWCDATALYLQFHDSHISLSNACMPQPLHYSAIPCWITSHGFWAVPNTMAIPFDPPYTLKLQQDEILLIRTDGIDDPIDKEIGEKNRKKLLEEILNDCKERPATTILNRIITELGRYFIPQDEEMDDATIVVIKRKSD